MYSGMERVEGIEPSSPAWKAGVIAFIRYPQAIDFIDFVDFKLQFYSMVSLKIAVVQVSYRFLVGPDGAKYNAPK